MRTEHDRDTEVIDLTARGDTTAQGDDIAVVADEPARAPRIRRPVLVAGAVIAVAIVGAGAIAPARRDGGTKTTSVRATAGDRLPVTETTLGASRPTAPTVPTATGAPPPTRSNPSPATVPVITRHRGAPTTSPSVTPPPRYPPSVLQWSAPSAMTMATNTHTTITVTVANPTDGIVELPYPLSCTPTLDGSSVCAAVTQPIQPHEQVTQRYTIDATGIAPGRYTLQIEGGLRSTEVTVTA